jgi:asparagine synthetase B (glutamine-hydrolysing)
MSRLDKHLPIPNDFINFDETESRLEEGVESQGVAFIEGLEGIFGHVYESGGRIKAFTDWIGQYPLYFLIIRDRSSGLEKVVFANHIAAFLSYPGYAYQSVYRVPPSYLVVIDSKTGDIEYQRYYRLPRYSEDEVREKVGSDLEEIGTNYRRILYEEVEKRLPPEGTKIGVALGGIDSLQVLKVLVDLRPDDVFAYNIVGEDTLRNRNVATTFHVRLKEVPVPRSRLLENNYKLVADILDNFEDFDPLDVYSGFACFLMYEQMHKDRLGLVATGNGGNAWSGMYLRNRWFQIDEDDLIEIPVRRRLVLGHPPASGFYHQQLGNSLSKGLSVYDLKLVHKFGLPKILDPYVNRRFMTFALNIPSDYFRFTKSDIESTFAGLVKDTILTHLAHFPTSMDGRHILARFPVHYCAFKSDIPEELFPLVGKRFYDQVGVSDIIDSVGGEDLLVGRFNARFMANETKR